MFDADRPIVRSEQDRLNRTVFAQYLARCMLDHTSVESLVIGLYGGWGSGKTSLINLTLEELRLAASNMLDDEKPIILNFSPWSYSGQGQLIYGFYRRLSSVLRLSPALENAEKIVHLLELYVSFFTHQPVPKALRLKRNIFPHLKKTISEKQAYAWESGRDPTQVKAELNELLKKQKHKIIIVIDNISRLEPKEINQILQIVKSMGDYANTIYLLTFDKKQIISAIDKIHPGEGKNYLEKLVQLPFEVPPISTQSLENLLLDQLQQIVLLAPERLWNKIYWADIYYSTLKYFFNSCRDITRYINTLSFSFPRVKDVVNPVDFFALTAIEVFAPGVFFGIRENKDLFADLIDDVYALDKTRLEVDKIRCDDILSKSDKISFDVLLQLLLHLFPRLRNIYTPEASFYHHTSLARKNRRICSPDTFDIYFRLSIPVDYMSESEVENILTFSNDQSAFSEALLRLNQDNRVAYFLDWLDGAAIHKISSDNISPVVSTLIDTTDLFPEGESNLLRFNTPMRVHRVIHQLLRRLSTMEERFIILQNAITQANKSLYIITHEITLQNQEHLETEDTYLPSEYRALSSEHIQKLQRLAVGKIEFWAHIGRLGEHPKLLPILYAWKMWGNEEACKKFVNEWVREDKGVLAFLLAVLNDPVQQAMTQLVKNPQWTEKLDIIRDFVSLDVLGARVKTLFEDSAFETLREREQLAVLIFLDLVKIKTLKVIPKTTV